MSRTIFLGNYNFITFFISGLVAKEVCSNEASWALDGRVIMDQYPHFQHVSHLILQLNSYIFQQFPPEYQALVNSEKFLDSVSIILENKDNISNVPECVNAGTWEYASDGAALNANTQDVYAVTFDHSPSQI